MALHVSMEMKRERENLWFIVCHVTQKRRLNKFVPHFYLLQWLLCDVSTPMHTCMYFESSFHDCRCVLWSCPQNSSLRRMRGLRLMASLSNWMHFRKRERIFIANKLKKSEQKRHFEMKDKLMVQESHTEIVIVSSDADGTMNSSGTA